MSSGDALRELLSKMEDLLFRERPAEEQVVERPSGNELHDEVIDAALGVEVMHGRDVWMVEPGERQRFPLEAAAGRIVVKRVGRQDFDGDIAIEMLVAGAIDDPHAAGADLLHDAVVSQLAVDQSLGLHVREDLSIITGESDRNKLPLMNWILKNFLRGLVIVVPIALTLYVVYQTFVAIDRLLKLPTPGLGVAIIVVAVILIGALASNFVVRKFLQLTEAVFTRAPIVRIIYAAIKDLLEAFVGNKRRFDKPVAVTLIEGSDLKVFGFLTREDLGSLALPGYVAVYLPFSYTWDGCMILVPASRVEPLAADSASIMALVVSGGVTRV